MGLAVAVPGGPPGASAWEWVDSFPKLAAAEPVAAVVPEETQNLPEGPPSLVPVL